MKHSIGFLTLGQMADIHHLNKRTLHYYDDIGLFSPAYKGENGYRYYRFEQSMARLKCLKQALEGKSNDLSRCREIRHGEIRLIEQPEQYLLLTPLPLSFKTRDNLVSETSGILNHLMQAWSLSSYRKNCGSFLSLEKVRSQSFQVYDGVFSTVDKKRKSLYIRPKGRYLRGFSVGDWAGVQDVYGKMLHYADTHGLRLSGYAFEWGINEFAIASEEEYITQIEIYAE